MIYLRKEKTFSLLYDLSLENGNDIVAVRYALISAKFYLTTYFTIGTPDPNVSL